MAMPRTSVLSISPALNTIALTTVCDALKKAKSHQKKTVKSGSSSPTAQYRLTTSNSRRNETGIEIASKGRVPKRVRLSHAEMLKKIER